MNKTELAAAIAAKQQELADLIQQLLALGGGSTAPSPTPAVQDAAPGATLVIKAVDGKDITTDGSATVPKGSMVTFYNGRTTPVMSTKDGITLTTREAGADSEKGLAAIVGTKLTVNTVPEVETPKPSTPDPSPVPDPTPVPTPSQPSTLRTRGRVGINLGMGAGADHVIPGKMGTNYNLPSEAEIKRAVGYGFKQQRWGILFGRIFKDSGTANVWRGVDPNDTTQKYTLDTLIDRLRYAAGLGVKVLIDNHAYGYFPSNGAANKALIGSAAYTEAQFSAQWLYVVKEIQKDATAWSAVYGIDVTNEPYAAAHDAAALVKIYQAVIDALAPISGDMVFVLEGPGYSSTRNWVANWKGLFSKITHPRGKAFIEPSGHLYLDQGADGYYDEGDTLSAADIKAGVTFATVGTSRAKEFKAWAKAEGYNANLGENLVTGSLPQLLTGEAGLLAENYADGIDTYLFGMGDWFGSNPHNIELPINAPMLALAKTWAAKGNA